MSIAQATPPVRINLSRAKYESLIRRHGQWVRWLRATKCTCVSSNGRPDINCKKCGGDGWLYSFQERASETLSLPCLNGQTLELPYPDARIVGIYDYMGLVYHESARYGAFAKIEGDRIPLVGEELQVVLDRPLLKTAEETPLKYCGNGCFEAYDLRVTGDKGFTQEHSTAVDIVSVGALINTVDDMEYSPTGYRRNLIFSDAEPDNGALVVARDVKYIEPFLFAVVGQQHNEPDWKFLEAVGGEASMTFPEWAGVGEGDIVTVLANSQVGKVIIDKSPDGMDTIPVFYVDSIEYIQSGDTKYYQDQDFELWGANKIKWCTGVGPKSNATIFVLFRYFPTYRVIREFPNVRSSENQNLPRRVALKLLSTYGERKQI